jgi:hypothetical protein
VQPYIAQFNGTSWRHVTTPSILGGGRLTDIVALSPTNILAIGNSGSGGTPLVLHWNGSAWTRETTPNAVNLSGAAVVGPNTFWAVGNGFDLSAYEDRNLILARR